jgi:DNA-binding MarR family transcriptional regulator
VDLARTTPADPVGYANRELTELSAAYATAFTRWLASSTTGGLSFPRLRVLEALHCKGPARLKDLADLLDMSARNLTSLADGLEQDGLARRVPHPHDRRATLLELTPAGVEAAEEALAPRLDQMGRLFDRLSPTQQRSFAASLRRLLDAMQSDEARPPSAT